MDENLIAEFKQFIATTISQNTVKLQNEIADLKANDAIIKDDLSSLRQNITRTDKKVDNLTVFIGDVLDASNEINGARLKNHDRRIIRLEHKVT